MHVLYRSFLLLLCLSFMVACVKREDVDVLELRIAEQDQQIKQMNQKLEASRPAQADTWSEVQSMRSRLASLESSVDDMQRMNTQSGAQQQDITKKLDALQKSTNQLDAGLRVVASQMAIDLPMLQSPAQQGAASQGAPEVSQGAAPAPAASSAPAAATPPSGKGTLVAPDGTELVVNPGKPATAAPAQSAAQAPEPAITEQKLYDAAFDAFKDRRYKDAVRLWGEFEKTYPKHSLVPNAVFWQGESSYQLNEYAPAILAYQRVIDNYPKSDKYRSAMLKQGTAFVKLGKAQAGKVRLEELIKKFPKTQEAERAKKALAEIK